MLLVAFLTILQAWAGSLDQVRVFAGEGHARVVLVVTSPPEDIETRASPAAGGAAARGIVTLDRTDLGPAGERTIEIDEGGVQRIQVAAVGRGVQVTVECDESRTVAARRVGETAVIVDLLAPGFPPDTSLPTAEQLEKWLDGVSLVRAAGGPPRQRALVVVDAGHGGWDPGARGLSGTRESDLALEIARRVALGLEQELGVEVILTRDSDVFVTLQERAAVANRHDADLFISIHANAAPGPGAWGIETYSHDTASDAGAARVAARENALLAEQEGEGDPLMARLVTSGTNRLSRELAGQVQATVVSRLTDIYGEEQIRDLGAKTALFYVLVSTRMPAILFESHFVTNSEDERRVRTPHFQQATADAIVEAIGVWLAAQK